jgi:hypothetical protein
MFTENALSVTVERNGVATTLDLPSDRVIVGSGAHCDVRLAPDEAALEQLVLEARDEQIFVEVRNLTPACRVQGALFLGGFLPQGEALVLGPLSLSAKLIAPQQAATTAQVARNQSQTHPAIQALGLVGVAVGMFYALQTTEQEKSVLATVIEPPLLFAEAGAAKCPQQDAEAALSFAQQERAAGDAKAERSPFYPGDGLAAVSSYERARVCFAVAGEKRAAQEAASASERLRQQLADELHMRHVRLERFLAQNKFDDVSREVVLLAELVPDHSHPYAQWLSAVRREVAVRNNQKGG